MMQSLVKAIVSALSELKGIEISADTLSLEKTPQHFSGDITLVTFSLAKMLKTNPYQLAQEIGEYLLHRTTYIESYEVIKGFLNIKFSTSFLVNQLLSLQSTYPQVDNPKKIIIEFSSPNTNKPLHLGHLRNNFLGDALARILEAVGNEVIRINLINDRGIHICKAMLAYQKWGNSKTPASTGIKPDHFIGKFYVLFEQELKKQMKELQLNEQQLTEAPLMQEALQMLERWEANDPQVRSLWQTMRDWALEGFQETYQRTDTYFDEIQFESDLYEKGKTNILQALENQNPFIFRDESGAVVADLTSFNLDKKILLRSNGTSVYITQDIGTAIHRYDKYHPDEMIYVVGNEQEYHFAVLKNVLHILGYDWSSTIHHYSYGMVELPEGKMKSREGKVVDADDLLDELHQLAKEVAQEAGKANELDPATQDFIFEKIGQAAIKYFILKVDPAKNILFNPNDNLEFTGNTGPFLQYTHARICSLLERSTEEISPTRINIKAFEPQERKLLLTLLDKNQILIEAAKTLNPNLLANYLYELASNFNSFYQEIPVLKEPDTSKRHLRLYLAQKTAEVLKSFGQLLNIYMPERM
jgi:arginyl-tRNA synthetase